MCGDVAEFIRVRDFVAGGSFRDVSSPIIKQLKNKVIMIFPATITRATIIQETRENPGGNVEAD